jgi:hypothetical protein
MKCFHIDNKEIELIMKKGIINYRGSEINYKPCPELLLQGVISGKTNVKSPIYSVQ